jgi:hypothetical protein
VTPWPAPGRPDDRRPHGPHDRQSLAGVENHIPPHDDDATAGAYGARSRDGRCRTNARPSLRSGVDSVGGDDIRLVDELPLARSGTVQERPAGAQRLP